MGTVQVRLSALLYLSAYVLRLRAKPINRLPAAPLVLSSHARTDLATAMAAARDSAFDRIGGYERRDERNFGLSAPCVLLSIA